MTAVFVLVVGTRFLLPLAIPFYPLPAIVACLIVDGVDQTIFQAFGHDPPNYQSYDKAMDVFYLSMAYLSTLRNWESMPAFRIGWFLYFYRLVGALVFGRFGAEALERRVDDVGELVDDKDVRAKVGHKVAHQRRADKASPARHQHTRPSHRITSSSSPRGSPSKGNSASRSLKAPATESLSDKIGWSPFSGQAIARSGSSQATERSLDGA